MKKSGILNAQLSGVIAGLGHGDRLVVCDSGLPVPHGAELVDLALTKNIPRFIETVRTILSELNVEAACVAKEMKSANAGTYRDLSALLDGVPVESVTHEEFKKRCSNGGTIVFVRTGEATPFANVVLISGVAFD